MKKQDVDGIKRHLEIQTRGGEPMQELAFDPATGELRLIPRGAAADSPDTVVIDQIAEEGFFLEPA